MIVQLFIPLFVIQIMDGVRINFVMSFQSDSIHLGGLDMEQVGRLIGPGSVKHSENFELTFVSGTQRAPSGVLYNVREIDYDVMRVVLAEFEYDLDALLRIELRLQGAIWAWAGGCPGYELLGIRVTLEEVCCPLLPHGMRKGVSFYFYDTWSTVLRFRVRRKVQLTSLLDLASTVVARCLSLESDCEHLEIPQELVPDIKKVFQGRWTYRSCQVKRFGGLCPSCRDHAKCSTCFCSSQC